MDKLTKLVERLENIADRLETAAIREKSTQSTKSAPIHKPQPSLSNMASIDSIINGPLKNLASLSEKIGGDVKSQVTLALLLQ